MTHGTTSAYNNMGCRCQPCKAANAAHIRAMRAQARERAKTDPRIIPHGTAHAYAYWGCRCSDCREAARVAVAKYRQAAAQQ